MARFFEVGEIEAKKRALIAESEVYRSVLTLEVQNIRIYGGNLKSKLSVLKRLEPLLTLSAALAGVVQRKPARPPRGLFHRAARVWRIYRLFSPVLNLALAQKQAKEGSAKKSQEPAPATRS